MATATSLAANKVNKPVRVVLDLKTCMEMFGKKLPFLGKYKVSKKYIFRFDLIINRLFYSRLVQQKKVC